MSVLIAQSEKEPLRGFAFALCAYLLWGFLPLFMKAVAHVPPAEIVAHRIVWSIPIAGAVLLALGRTGDITAALKSPRALRMAALTAALISVNWGIYVWAIAADRTLETALGYYINPLVNVLLGAVLLGERLNRAQRTAVGLAAAAVVILTVDAGGLPWVSLALAVSFGFYGYFRKTLPIGPSQGFFLEVLILGVPSLCYIVWLQTMGQGNFLPGQPLDLALLVLCGPVTAVPLILYAFGAKLLKYSTIGIMQYSSPTMIFLIAVFVFEEPFNLVKLAAFVLIWSALAIYSWSMVRDRAKAPDPTDALKSPAQSGAAAR
jgi:chloramphenicol-sensitive protein RarD